MVRLWLTDEQANSVRRALRCQIKELYKHANEMHNEGAHDIEEKYVNEANILDDVVDVLDYSIRK